MSGSRWAALPARYADQAMALGVPCTTGTRVSRSSSASGEPTEYEHQVDLVTRCAEQYQASPDRYPGLDLINASANGGKRLRGVAGQLKAMGVQDGFPDLELPVARGGYFGLYIELKRPRTGRASDSQLKWQARLRDQGYRAEICYGADEAWTEIHAYFAMPPTQIVQTREAASAGN